MHKKVYLKLTQKKSSRVPNLIITWSGRDKQNHWATDIKLWATKKFRWTCIVYNDW